jgi:hypothetical protein
MLLIESARLLGSMPVNEAPLPEPVEGCRSKPPTRPSGALRCGCLRRPLKKGWSWKQIGDALGVTRQSVHTKYNDRLRMTPAAKKVLEEAVKPNRRKTQVTAQQVLAQILTLQPPDPAAVLLGALGVNTPEVRRRLDAVTPDS